MLCSAFLAAAQESAELTGEVTDQTGAVIPGASVSVTNIGTGEIRAGTTNSAGLYSFPALHIGTYNLKVSASGFESYEKTGIVMNVAATVREDLTLKLGTSSVTVTVQANELHLQTETNEVSNLITGQQLTQLATNGRNMVSLTTLGTGVTNNLNSFNGVTAQGSGFGLSFNGMRPDHNNWLIDGGEAYDRGSGGKFDLMPSPDVLAEFQTLSSNYSPDYGISSGGTVTMALKSGGKEYHGGVWEFNRNDTFDAKAYFSKQNLQPTPELRLNIFGGGIGGPAFIPGLYPKDKNKTFFFYSEEWRRYIAGANPSVTNTVPAANFPTAGQDLNYQPWNELAASKLPAGVCNNGVAPPCVPITADPKYVGNGYVFDPNNPVAPTGGLYGQYHLVPGNPFPNNTIPAALLDANAIRFMSTGAIPKPNIGTSQFSSSPKQPTFVREDVVRVDHDITDRLHLMGHWIHDQMSQTIYPTMWSGDSYTTVGDVFKNPSWSSVIKLTDTVSPSVLNETAFNVNGNTININPAGIYAQPQGWGAGSFFTGNNAMNRMPAVAFGAPLGTNWTEIYWPWRNAFLDYQIRDDVSWNYAKHGFKFGASYMRMDKNQQLQADTQGDYTFGTDFSGDSYLNLLLGFADSYQQLQYLATAHWVNNTYSFYGLDNWRVLPRLTLNLGLRYDALPHVYEKNNRVANFVPADYVPSSAPVFKADGSLDPTGPGFSTVNGITFYSNGIRLAGTNGYPRGVVNNNYLTLQPRLGFAWQMSGSGKTILRGGMGVFYERVQGNDIYGAAINQPFAYQPSTNSVYFSDPKTNAKTGATSTSPVLPANITNLSRYYPNPATMQYSLGIQHELTPSVVGVVQYVGSGGWNQAIQRAINTLPLADLTGREAVAGGAAANPYRTYPGFAGINQEENSSSSNYNSMQIGVRGENWHGLTGQLSYTWSHEIDIASGDLGSTNFAGGQSYISNPFSLRYDRGSGVLDRRHIFSVNYDYPLPFYRTGHGLQRTLLGGWEFSGVTVAQTGTPRLVRYSPDTLGLGGGTVNRPNKVASASGAKTQKAWFKTAAFAAPTPEWTGGANHGFGTAGKDSVVGPGLFNWNMSLFKTFPLTERDKGSSFELRFESFNVFNHTQFNGIDTGFTDSNFGQVTSAYDPRVMQFGGKFRF